MMLYISKDTTTSCRLTITTQTHVDMSQIATYSFNSIRYERKSSRYTVWSKR